MKRVFVIAFTIVALLACNKEKEETFCTDATIRFMGDPAADGLGWVISKDDSVGMVYYVPSNLPELFKKIGLEVNVCLYKTADKVNCFCAAPPNKYFVTSIRPR